MAEDDSNQAEELIVRTYNKLADNAWLRGLIQALPVVGGTLDTWLFQVAERTKAERVEAALNDLKERVGKLEVNNGYIQEHIEEFGYLTERSVIYIAQDYRPEMRDAYVKMLAHFYSEGFSSLDNKELYLQYLSLLSPAHLVTLKHFADGLQDSVLKIQPDDDPTDKINEFVGHGVDRALALSLVNDLVTRGMLAHNQQSVIGGDTHVYSVTELGKTMLKLVND